MVDGNGLENRRAGNGTESSNLSLSAKIRSRPNAGDFLFNIARPAVLQLKLAI